MATLAVGFYGSRVGVRTLLRAASLLMLATEIGFAAASGFWPLLLIAFVGTLNPSAGDVSVFLPLEQTALSGAIANRDRTDLFTWWAHCSVPAVGLLAIVPDHLPAWLVRIASSSTSTRQNGVLLARLDALAGHRRVLASVLEWQSAGKAVNIQGRLSLLGSPLHPPPVRLKCPWIRA